MSGGGWIRQRNGKYYVEVDLGPDPATNRRRRKGVGGGFKTKREAKAALAAVQTDRARGDWVEPSRQTLAAFLDDWQLSKRQEIKPATVVSYAAVLRHATDHIGGLELRALTGARINKLYLELQKDGGRRDGTKGGLSPRTVRYLHTVLRQALNDAVAQGKLKRNPMLEGVKAPKVPKAAMHTWDRDELRRFLDAAVDHPLHIGLLLAATTGMRRGEVLGLRWSDVDLNAGTVSVQRNLTTVGREVVEGDPKTGKGRRVDLDTDTVAALRSHRAGIAEARLAWGPAWQGSTRVVAREDGSAVHPNALSAAFEAVAASAGLPYQSRRQRPPEDGQRAPRALDDRDHSRHLQPRDPVAGTSDRRHVWSAPVGRRAR